MADVFLPDNYLQIAIKFETLGIGSVPTNILTCLATPAPGGAALLVLADAIGLVYEDAVSEDTSIVDVVFTFGDTGGPPYLTAQTGYTRAMVGDWPSAPPNVCSLVQKRSALAGRRGRGRIYLPGANEGAIGAGGLLNGGAQAVLQDFCTALDLIATDEETVLTAWAVPHDLASGLIPSAGVNHVPSPYAATVRRRLRK